MKEPKGEYAWDTNFTVTTDDCHMKLLGRYRYFPPDGESFSVAKVYALDEFPEDVFVKVPSLLPLAFSSLELCEAFVEAWFRTSVREQRK